MRRLDLCEESKCKTLGHKQDMVCNRTTIFASRRYAEIRYVIAIFVHVQTNIRDIIVNHFGSNTLAPFSTAELSSPHYYYGEFREQRGTLVKSGKYSRSGSAEGWSWAERHLADQSQ
jgi:hypothetical protein